jgi:hypothetical protein
LIPGLAESWIKPDFRFDRIVFTNLEGAQKFLESIELSNWGIPRIICSPHHAYDLDNIFHILGSQAPQTKLEILCGDTLEEKTSLGFFLEDKLAEYRLETPPRCSLVHPNYEIEYRKIAKKSKKRTRKPPAAFQRLLKKKAPEIYPDTIGNDYYARPVFHAFATQQIAQELASEESEIENDARSSLPLPPSPLKYYDLQPPNGAIEFRFEKYMSVREFPTIIDTLQDLIQHNSRNIEMIRINLLYESWQTEQDFHNAGRDRCFFTWNDFKFAFRESNIDVLQGLENHNSTTLYFQLTPQILPDDFRIQILESCFNAHAMLR